MTKRRLYGIQTIDDMRGRCVIDGETDCWHLRKADGKKMPNTKATMRVWIAGVGTKSAIRAAWELQHGQLDDDTLQPYRQCGCYDCINPAHMLVATKEAHGRMARRSGRQRGRAERSIINTRIGMKNAKITAELAQWARESEQTLQDAAHGLSIAMNRVGLIRRGQAWKQVGGM